MKALYSIWLYCKTLFFVILFFPIMIVIAILIPSLLYKYARFLSKGVFWCFNIKRNIIGRFPEDGPYILMHNQKKSKYNNLLDEVFYSLNHMVENTVKLGIDADKIIIDPGIGFGKTPEQNIDVIRHLEEFLCLWNYWHYPSIEYSHEKEK